MMEKLNRRRFLVLVPAMLGTGALSSVLSGCGGANTGEAVDGTVTAQNGQAVLPFAQFPKLQSIGGFVVVRTTSGGTYLVIRSSATIALALTAVCTHAHCLVGYQASLQEIVCPCHGSRYSTSGSVLQGPAIAPLTTFAAALDATGVTITVG
jgi:cytochrome b6-f complex iron-sulfur subunit